MARGLRNLHRTTNSMINDYFVTLNCALWNMKDRFRWKKQDDVQSAWLVLTTITVQKSQVERATKILCADFWPEAYQAGPSFVAYTYIIKLSRKITNRILHFKQDRVHVDFWRIRRSYAYVWIELMRCRARGWEFHQWYKSIFWTLMLTIICTRKGVQIDAEFVR